MSTHKHWLIDISSWARSIAAWTIHTLGWNSAKVKLRLFVRCLRHDFNSYGGQGWRFGIINCAVFATLICVINMTVTIILSFRARSGLLFEGDCNTSRRINTGLHLVINAMSTILLSSSNYCMQCLSAPTRKEVDKAHAQSTSLNIGVISLGNLRRISKKRVVVWFLLGASSIPLHLL